jgi:hypothetical protein
MAGHKSLERVICAAIEVPAAQDINLTGPPAIASNWPIQQSAMNYQIEGIGLTYVKVQQASTLERAGEPTSVCLAQKLGCQG